MSNHESPDVGEHDITCSGDSTEQNEEREVEEKEYESEYYERLRFIPIRKCMEQETDGSSSCK